MKQVKHLFLLLFICLSFWLEAQVSLPSDLRFGDTTQVHVLKTVNGDRFSGLATGFDSDHVQFFYRNNEMEFAFKEIKSIAVEERFPKKKGVGVSPVPKPSGSTDTLQEMAVDPISPSQAKQYIWPFEYRVVMKSGEEYSGILSAIKNAFLVLGKGTPLELSMRDVQAIELMGERIDRGEDVPNEHHRLETADEDVFRGQLLSFDGREYRFLMPNGSELTFPSGGVEDVYLTKKKTDEVKANDKDDAVEEGYFYNQQRVFFTPSAFLLEEGTKEFRTMILYNHVDFGLSDNVTVGTGISTVLVVSAVSGKLKVGASMGEYFHVGVGAQGLLAVSVFDSESASLGLVYGAVSIGTKEHFLNIGIGRGSSNQDSHSTTGYTLGGSARIGTEWRIYGEYMRFQENYDDGFAGSDDRTVMGSMGLSWFKRQHQIDFGFYASELFSEDIAIPMIGYSWRF